MSIYEIDSISFHQTECICLLLKRQILVWRANNSKRIYKFLHIKFGRYRSNDIRLK